MRIHHRRAAAYLACIAAIMAVVLLPLYLTGVGPAGYFFVGLVFLIPGRLAGIVWRNFYRGKRQLQAGDLAASIASSRKFIEQVRASPWKKWPIYLKWGWYTWDIEAMALNNLGAAASESGDLALARDSLEEALRLDGNYAVAHFNLAVVEMRQGNQAAAWQRLQRAESLGMSSPALAMMKRELETPIETSQ